MAVSVPQAAVMRVLLDPGGSRCVHSAAITYQHRIFIRVEHRADALGDKLMPALFF
jgi:hypothetical protein